METVARSEIATALRTMGLAASDKVMVHSSLSSMGHVEGGADTVVDAILDVLGREGTLMVPTFTHSGCEYFDPLMSLSLNGAITEAVRKRPDVLRSFHPTHAVAVIGPDAEDLLLDDVKRGALGRDCALDKLHKSGGWVLLLGVSQEYNSTIHIGEDYGGDNRTLGIFNPENPKIVILNHPEQGEIQVPLTEMMGNTVAFARMYDELRERGQLIEANIGKAPCQLMKGQDVIDTAIDILTA